MAFKLSKIRRFSKKTVIASGVVLTLLLLGALAYALKANWLDQKTIKNTPPPTNDLVHKLKPTQLPQMTPRQHQPPRKNSKIHK
jgi:hypothetical protein